MDKSMIKGVVVGGIAMVVLGAGGVTGYKALTQPKFAEVVAVKEITETVVTPREQCGDVQVQHQAQVKDKDRIAGTVVGGLAGGLLGSTVAVATARLWPLWLAPRPGAIPATRCKRTCSKKMSSRAPSTAARR